MGEDVMAHGNLPALAGPLRFPGISSRAYEHPLDQTALVALRKLPGLDVAIRKLQGMFSERSLRIEHLATTVLTSERQFAGIHEMCVTPLT